MLPTPKSRLSTCRVLILFDFIPLDLDYRQTKPLFHFPSSSLKSIFSSLEKYKIQCAFSSDKQGKNNEGKRNPTEKISHSQSLVLFLLSVFTRIFFRRRNPNSIYRNSKPPVSFWCSVRFD